MPEHKTGAEHRAFAKKQRRVTTNAEAVVWDLVRAGRINGLKFKRQVPFGPYVADFSCAAASLIIEVDGRTHADELRALKDGDRDRYFARKGFRVLRLPDDFVVGSPAWALDQIREAVEMTAPSPCPPSAGCPSPSRGEGR